MHCELNIEYFFFRFSFENLKKNNKQEAHCFKLPKFISSYIRYTFNPFKKFKFLVFVQYTLCFTFLENNFYIILEK